MVELTPEEVQRLDALRSERNLSRGELPGLAGLRAVNLLVGLGAR